MPKVKFEESNKNLVEKKRETNNSNSLALRDLTDQEISIVVTAISKQLEKQRLSLEPFLNSLSSDGKKIKRADFTSGMAHLDPNIPLERLQGLFTKIDEPGLNEIYINETVSRFENLCYV